MNIRLNDKLVSVIDSCNNRNEDIALKQLAYLLKLGGDVNARNINGQTALGMAVCSGYAKIVDFLIKNGADVNIVDNEGNTPILDAAYMGDEVIFKKLVEAGADIRFKNQNRGIGLLSNAIWGGNDEKFIEYVISVGGDVNEVDKDKTTPLMFAASMGYEKVVEVLIKKGADVGLRDKSGNSALDIGVMQEWVDVVKVLLDGGANPNDVVYNQWEQGNYEPILSRIIFKKDVEVRKNWLMVIDELLKHGADMYACFGKHNIENVWQKVVKRSDEEVVDVFIKNGVDVNRLFYGGYSSLSEVLLNGKIGVARKLLEHGGDPCLASGCGNTALIVGIKKGYKLFVDEMIEKACNLDARGADGKTALMMAVVKNDVEIVEKLIVAGADVNVKDSLGDTSLFKVKSPEVAKILLENGIKTGEKNCDEETALMEACKKGDLSIVEVIIDKMTIDEINERDKKGITALMMAVENGNNEIVKLLINKGADIELHDKWNGTTALMIAAKKGNKEMVDFLVANGADIYATGSGDNAHFGAKSIGIAKELKCKENYFFYLASGGYIETLEWKLSEFDVNSKDEWNRTALMEASRNGCSKVVGLLLENGGNVNDKDVFGRTALIYACIGGKYYKEDVVEKLLKNGADVFHKDKWGMNALMYAEKYCRNDVVKMLKEYMNKDVKVVSCQYLGKDGR